MDEHVNTREECTISNEPTLSEPAASQGRRPKFTAEEDLILVREVAAAHAHAAPYGDIRTLFANAAHCANSNADFKCMARRQIHCSSRCCNRISFEELNQAQESVPSLVKMLK